MNITQAQGNGQGWCTLCKERGKWNRTWMVFLYKIEGKDGVYCKNCIDDLELASRIIVKPKEEEQNRDEMAI